MVLVNCSGVDEEYEDTFVASEGYLRIDTLDAGSTPGSFAGDPLSTTLEGNLHVWSDEGIELEGDIALSSTQLAGDGEEADEDECVVIEGVWTGGDLAIDISVDVYGHVINDTCEGSISLLVDTSVSPHIDGTAECEFIGTLSAFFPDTYTGTVSGDYISDEELEGSLEMTVDSVELEANWVGSDDGDTLLGEIETDTTTWEKYDVEYSGSFSIEH